MQVNFFKRNFLHGVKRHHHHSCHPKENNVGTCYQVAAVYKKLNNNKKTQIYNYHLKNNKIVIDQEDYFNKSIIIEYYPTPTFLTYKDDITAEELPNNDVAVSNLTVTINYGQTL